MERAAEPLSARLETHAARSERFRMLCGRIANAYNNLDHNKQQRRAHRDSALHPQPHERIELEPPPTLSEPDATALGCQLLGEGFVIGVGLALLIHQVAPIRSPAFSMATVLQSSRRGCGRRLGSVQMPWSSSSSWMRGLTHWSGSSDASRCWRRRRPHLLPA